jgi:predicted phosphodiesterase
MMLTLFAVLTLLVQPRESTAQPQKAEVVIAAAGDIACDPAGTIDRTLGAVLGWCRMADTERLIQERHVDAVLALGDEQYQSATTDGFAHGYDLTWGKSKAITYPTPGNHEYYTPGAAGYFAYFGARAGDARTGYYSFTLGSWHIISLNGNCDAVGGCDAGSAQERWLRSDLTNESSGCTLAFWHQPRFSSGGHHSDVSYTAFWADLYAEGADVVLAGHDHDYERFAPQTATGTLDRARGIREFVVGTGGKSHDFFSWTAANSEVRDWETYGILFMTLRNGSFDWQFAPIAGRRFSDHGTGTCHGKR